VIQWKKSDQIADGGIFTQLLIAVRADGIFLMKSM
jgi:hypothetical protein